MVALVKVDRKIYLKLNLGSSPEFDLSWTLGNLRFWGLTPGP